tara:strand:- start:1007 stop:1411 length:405 start_codon:yes stop_codon:yes gene_type:complete
LPRDRVVPVRFPVLGRSRERFALDASLFSVVVVFGGTDFWIVSIRHDDDVIQNDLRTKSNKEKNAFCALSLSPFFFFVSFRKDNKNASSTRRGVVVVVAEAFFSGERKKERKEGRKEDDKVSKKRHKKCRFFPR